MFFLLHKVPRQRLMRYVSQIEIGAQRASFPMFAAQKEPEDIHGLVIYQPKIVCLSV